MKVSRLEAIDNGKWFPFLGLEGKKGFLSVPGTHRERRSKGERKREEEVEEKDEVEAEG